MSKSIQKTHLHVCFALESCTICIQRSILTHGNDRNFHSNNRHALVVILFTVIYDTAATSVCINTISSTETSSAIMTESFRGFPQSHQENAWITP
jgi:hypothetical protein